MTILTILNKQQDLIIGDVAISETFNDKHYEDLKGVETYNFHTFAENKINLLVERNKVILPIEDGFFREFVITHSYLDRLYKKLEINSSPSYLELAKAERISPVKWEGETINTAMDKVLIGTGWVRGITEGLNIRTVTFEEHVDPYKALNALATLFDLELRFRIEVDGVIIKRVVDMVKKRGEIRASEFEVGKDIIGITREMSGGDIVTAMLGLGPELEDGTRLTVEVFDDEALERWGVILDGEKQHLWGTHEVQTEDANMTEARLRQLTEAQLKKQINSVIKYVVDAVSVEYIFGYSHEKVRLGDTKPVKDTSFSPHLFMDSRIIAVERKPSDPSKKTFVLGDFIEYNEQDIYADFRALQKRFRESIKNAEQVLIDYVNDNAEQIIPTQPTAPLKPTLGDKWVDISANPVELKIYDGTKWTAVKGPKGDPGINGHTPVKGTDYFDGVDGQDGKSSYLWVRYSQNANGSGMVTAPTNAKYVGIVTTTTSTAPTSYTSYQWTLIKGSDGVAGETGTDGKTSYLHIKYSDNGTTFTSNNGETVGAYIGTYVDFTQADSMNFSDYTWNKVKGEKGDIGERGLQGLQGPNGSQGIPGAKGVDGLSSYTHIAYATNATGTTGFSVSDPVGKTYIGMYVDNIATDSTVPSKYKWTLIKGADGTQGIPGPTGSNGATSYLHIAYATNATGTVGFSTTDSTGKTYIGQYTDITEADSTVPSKYKWTLIKGDTGVTGPQGIPGTKGADGQTLYTWVKYADSPTTGMTDTPSGKTYIGFAYNKTTAAESSTYADYSWSLIKGADGVKGAPGVNGVTTYTWIRYADTITGTGMSDSPTDKRYLGIAVNKTTATESNVATDYVWSPLYDNVVVGGRNLIRDTALLSGGSFKYTHSNKAGEGGYQIVENRFTEPLVSGLEYTISVELRGNASMVVYRLSVGGNLSSALVSPSDLSLTEYKKFKLTFKAHKTLNAIYIFTGYRTIAYTEWFEIKEGSLKLEKGNVATDWNPAPEDVAADVKTKVDAAQAAAITEAKAADNLKETIIKAYADGKVTAEEQARINQAAANLAAAKSDATSKAAAAELAAKNAAALDATSKANQAKVDAKDYTDNNAVIINKPYTNGMLWDDLLGLIVARSDGKLRTVMSGTNGFYIERKVGTTWTKVFFADTNGNLIFTGDMVGGNVDGASFSTGTGIYDATQSIHGTFINGKVYLERRRTSDTVLRAYAELIAGKLILQNESGTTTINGGDINTNRVNASAIVTDNFINATLINGWIDYNSPSYCNAQFMRDPMGWVHLRGAVKNGTTSTAFILPVGYRPSKLLIHPAFSESTDTQPARVRIVSDGQVQLFSQTKVGFHLDGISFKAEV